MLANLTFGIQASGQFPDGMPEPGFFHELARTVEELGYGSLWSGDHVSYNHPTYVDQQDADRASRIARRHLAVRYDTEISEHVVDEYCLVGTPERCRRRLDHYVAAGASHVVFAPVGPPESVLDQVKLLRTEVIA